MILERTVVTRVKLTPLQRKEADFQMNAYATLGIPGIPQTLALSALLGNTKLQVAMSRVVHVPEDFHR